MREAPCTRCGTMTYLNSQNSIQYWGTCRKCGNKVILRK